MPIPKFALIIIGADGSTSITGPYSNEESARRASNRFETKNPGATADVYKMDSPSSLGGWR